MKSDEIDNRRVFAMFDASEGFEGGIGKGETYGQPALYVTPLCYALPIAVAYDLEPVKTQLTESERADMWTHEMHMAGCEIDAALTAIEMVGL